MNSIYKSKLLNIIISLSFALSHSAYGGTIQECYDKAKAKVEEAGGTMTLSNEMQDQYTKMVGSQLAENNIHVNAGGFEQAAGAVGDLNTSTAAKLQGLQGECAKACEPGQATDENKMNGNSDEGKLQKQIGQQCIDIIEPIKQKYAGAAGDAYNAAGQADQTERAAEGGGGGMSPMMAGLLGAALGAGAAMLLNKKKEDDKKKKEEEKEKEEDEVVKEDGTVDCAKPGAEAYSDCNEYFASKCEDSLDSEECKNFSGRYCSAASSNTNTETDTNSTPATSSTGVIIASAEDKDIKGEGLGTQFCFTSQATDFCASAGRETCPSCLQLETNKAEACKSNPALCMAQNSLADIEAAKNSCPSDPMFSNPDYMAGGGATVPDSANLPEPILPAPYASSSDSSSFTEGASDMTGSGYAIGGGDPSDVAGDSSDSSSSGISYSGSDSSSGIIGGGSASDVANGGLPDPVLPASANLASASRSPTSAGGVMGPSLFSMSSEIIESRCKQHQLAHCK